MEDGEFRKVSDHARVRTTPYSATNVIIVHFGLCGSLPATIIADAIERERAETGKKGKR